MRYLIEDKDGILHFANSYNKKGVTYYDCNINENTHDLEENEVYIKIEVEKLKEWLENQRL